MHVECCFCVVVPCCDQLWAGRPESQCDCEPAKPGASEPSGDLQKSGAKSQGRRKSCCVSFFSALTIRTWSTWSIWYHPQRLLAISQGDQTKLHSRIFFLCSLTGSAARGRSGYAARRSRLFPHRSPGWHRPHPDAHTLNPADRPPQLRPPGHRSETAALKQDRKLNV